MARHARGAAGAASFDGSTAGSVGQAEKRKDEEKESIARPVLQLVGRAAARPRWARA